MCQVSDLLPSIVQHIPHTEYGAEWVLLWMVVAVLDLLACHRGGEIPSETRNKMSLRLWETKARCAGETHLVTSKSGKRMLFLMKMVKLFTSSIGSLERTTEEDG